MSKILNRIEAVDIIYYCDGCKEPMKMTFVATKESNFEPMKCYCPKCVILEIDKNE